MSGRQIYAEMVVSPEEGAEMVRVQWKDALPMVGDTVEFQEGAPHPGAFTVLGRKLVLPANHWHLLLVSRTLVEDPHEDEEGAGAAAGDSPGS